MNRDALEVATSEDLEVIVDEPRPSYRSRSPWKLAMVAGLVVIGLVSFSVFASRESGSRAACNDMDLYDDANANVIATMPAGTTTGRTATLMNGLRTPSVEDVIVVDAEGGPGGQLEAHIRLSAGLPNDAVAEYAAELERHMSFDAVRVGACALTE